VKLIGHTVSAIPVVDNKMAVLDFPYVIICIVNSPIVASRGALHDRTFQEI